MSNLLNFKHLRYFWAVAHVGNLTKAAAALNVSQSAISVQIQKLEEQLGEPLFERQGKALSLTEAGRIALDHADTIFATGDELVGTLMQNRLGKAHNLRIGSEATLSRNFQMTFLRPLLGRHDVKVTLKSGAIQTLLQGLESHRLDVVLTNQPPIRETETRWVATELAKQNVSIVSAPGLETDTRSIGAILESAPLVVPGRGTTSRDAFDAYVLQHGLNVKLAAEVDDMAMLRLLAREGTGLAVIPPIVVQDELNNGRLINHGTIPGLFEAFHAITMDRRFPNPVLNELMSAMQLAAD